MTGVSAWRGMAMGLILAGAALAASAEDPWADEVLDYSPVAPVNPGFDTPEKTLGPPVGTGKSTPANTSLACLGVPNGSITLRFNTPVTDDPHNPMGLDCIVYGNSLCVGGDPNYKWQEPSLIEISRDVNGNGLADDPWYLIPGSEAYRYSPAPDHAEPKGDNNDSNPTHILAGMIVNPNTLDANLSNDLLEYFWGYAELNPVMRKYLDNYLRPDDPKRTGITPRSGGGDAFDIAWAVDASGQPAYLNQFDFIRLRAFIAREFDSFGYATPEIDAVADVAPDIDTDGDGILDEYETRVTGTDSARPGNTLLPLEIPPDEGGSSEGTLLGTARDEDGNSMTLIAGKERIDPARALDAIVDVRESPDPGGELPAPWAKSFVFRAFDSSVTDFVAAGIEPARFCIAYRGVEIAGLDETQLRPFRYDSGVYTSDGISEISIDTTANLIRFTSERAGVFALGSTPGRGDIKMPLTGAGWLAMALLLIALPALRRIQRPQ